MAEAKRYTRRDILRRIALGAGLVAAGLTAACRAKPTPETTIVTPQAAYKPVFGEDGKTIVGFVGPDQKYIPINSTAIPTSTPPPTGTPVTAGEPGVQAVATENVNYDIRGDLFTTAGIPISVDVGNVDVAKGNFKNTIGKGTEAWFAEPGKLLVGPDYPQDKIDESGGAIERLNPVNQTVFESRGPSHFNLPEGGFILATGNVMRIKVGDAVIRLEGAPGHNWMFVARGLYSDGKPDTDLNIQTVFTDYIPGHIQAMKFPGIPNGGFISEGQFKQIATTSHTEGTNCGANGCTGLSVFMYDANSGAAAVVKQSNVNGDWQRVWGNFPVRK